jgi:hypothetical protein
MQVTAARKVGLGWGWGGCNHGLGWIGGTTGSGWGTKTVALFGCNHIHSTQAIVLSIVWSPDVALTQSPAGPASLALPLIPTLSVLLSSPRTHAADKPMQFG